MRVIIIGAGLSGLTAAYLLSRERVEVRVLEARERLGGRIWTKTLAGEATAEAGATWFGAQHEQFLRLLEVLNLELFPQATAGISLFETMSFAPPQQFVIPDDEPTSFRVAGGTSAVIDALAEKIGPSRINLGDPVASLSFDSELCIVETRSGEKWEADRVIVTLPPRLFASNVAVRPGLPPEFVDLAKQTHTWMSHSIKFFVSYPDRFWADASFSGTAFSQAGIIPEMYDHSSMNKTALKGFLAGRAYRLSAEQRKKAVIAQLVSYFGPKAEQYLEYGDVLWANEVFTSVAELEELFPHQNNGHQGLRQSLFNGRLLLGGTETAEKYPGYMDGAVGAARRVVAEILGVREVAL